MKINSLQLLTICILFGHSLFATTRYVKQTATGLGDGSSWVNASGDLQSMINISSFGDEVWVAAGTYLPTQDPLGNSNPSDPREKTFRMKDSVNIYGGFYGVETSVSMRNISANATILSGDLGVTNTMLDNCYHVVVNVSYIGIPQKIILDGFIIQDGYANGTSWTNVNGLYIPQNDGGGIFIGNGTNKFTNLRIYNNLASSGGGGICVNNGANEFSNLYIYSNFASSGGGIYTKGGINIIRHDSIYNNSSSGLGGGIYAYLGNYSIDSNTICSNVASSGGGLFLSASGGLYNNSIFNNSADYGGGVFSSGWITFSNNTAFNNTASIDGGGFYIDGGNFTKFTFVNNVVFNNAAQDKGGGIYHNDADGNLINNTFYNNFADNSGSAICTLAGDDTLINNIFWANRTHNNSLLGSYVPGGFSSNLYLNNLFQSGADPLFVDSGQPLGPDGLSHTADDGLSLSPCSPAIDAGTTSPFSATDILGFTRTNIYDIGAYEYQGAAPVMAGTITGDSVICLNSTITLTNAVSGGVWSTSDPSVATVSSTGVVTGAGLGNAVISYTMGSTGCAGTIANKNITIAVYTPLNPIVGADSLCALFTTQLSSSTPGGVWSSSNPGVATVNASGIVAAISGGTAIISYTTGGAGCSNTVSKTIKVNSTPAIGPITGATIFPCQYSSVQYSNSAPGGVWSTSSNGIKSSISSSGLLTTNGVMGNVWDTIIYTVTSPSGCQQIAILQIYIVGSANFDSLTGPDSVCAGNAIQLFTNWGGATWTSSDNSIATAISGGSDHGIVTGIDSGMVVITCSGYNSWYYCTHSRSKTIYVNPAPTVSAIIGGNSICLNNSLQLGNTTTGGVWTTSSGGIVCTVNSTGLLSATSLGNDTVMYIVSNTYGCADTAILPITSVSAPVVANIQGIDSLCLNQTAVFINTTTGGSWSSQHPSIASVNSNGLITAVGSGTATIDYSVNLGTNCTTIVSKNIYISPSPAIGSITGAATACVNNPIQYNNIVPGGLWSTASNGSVGSISSSGLFTAVNTGVDTVRYMVANSLGCDTIVEFLVTVNAPSQTPIMSQDSLCVGASTPLNHAITNGVWSNFDTILGGINSTGVYTSTAPGIDTVYYQYISNGCPAEAKKQLVIQDFPDTALITGNTSLCTGEMIQLTPSIPGGTWLSSNNMVANVNNNGQVSGVNIGIVSIYYTLTSTLGCVSTSKHTLTVDEVITTISQSGATLTATGNQTGTTYQWIDCGNNNQPIIAATSQTYTASINGQYAVIVSYNSCVDTSLCVNVTTLGVEKSSDSNLVIISPNPADEYVYINTGREIADFILLFDAQGRLIQKISPNNSIVNIDVHQFNAGVYYIHFGFNGQKAVYKLVIQ